MNQKLLQLGRQLGVIWGQLGLNQRITIVFTAVGVVAAFTAMALWSGRADYTILYGKLDDTEAARVTSVLDEAKVPYRIGPGGGVVFVPRDKVHPMRMQLASRGIPRGDGIGFEIFDKPNFGISDFVQRANYIRALQGELGRTIAGLDEIESARVMVVMPENRLLVDNNKRPTASVFVRARVELPPTSVNAIRFLVANSVEGLQASQVTVVDNRGQVLSENHDENSGAGLTASQLAARRNLEQYLGRKAQTMLDAVLGAGQSVVRVAADINFDTTTLTEERYDPDGQVVRTSLINDETTDTTTADQHEAVGVVANAEVDTNQAAGTLNSSRLRKKTINSEYEINRTISSVSQVAGGLRQLSAAVFVAARTEGVGEARKLVPRSPEELEKLRRIVQSALGLRTDAPGITGSDQITLEEMPFTEQFVDVTQDLTREHQIQLWWPRIQNGLLLLLAVGILGAFWRMWHKTAVEEIQIGVPLSQMDEPAPHPTRNQRGALTTTTALSEPGRTRLSPQSSPVLSVEVFNQLVRENPENMSQAIQNWLTRGGGASN